MKRIHYFLTETVFSGLLLTTLLFSNCVTIDERYDYVKWSHKSADSKNCPKLEEGKESEFVKCNHDLELKKITKKEEAFSNLIKFKDGKNQISKPELDSYLNSAKDSFKAEKYTRAMYYSYFILQKSPD
ncbi:MAG TPA: hypothetical protein PKN56_27090, partial [Leptospiraceae bacterium]|nr:hypothetical protein [Leptospiraceae bacterium]